MDAVVRGLQRHEYGGSGGRFVRRVFFAPQQQNLQEDNDDQDGIRPESISVTLLADGEEADVEDATATLNEDNDWTYTWEDLDVNKAGTAIEYSVDEVEVEEYETEIGEVTGDAEEGFEVEITNTHEV